MLSNMTTLQESERSGKHGPTHGYRRHSNTLGPFREGPRSICPAHQGSPEKAEGDLAMKDERLAVVRGGGNVFRDLGHANADIEQFKALLAAEIVKALDRDGL